jgi:hypothetical protein
MIVYRINRSYVHAAALVTICLALQLHCAVATAQSAISGTFETYFEGQAQEGSGVPLRIAYLSMQDQVSPDTRIVVGALRQFGTVMLDENYLEKDTKHGIFRIGRFRSEFGHSDWSELYDHGLPNLPLIRANVVDYDDADGLNLTRLDTGVDYQTNVGNMQYQVGLIDMNSGSYQLAPREWNTAVTRVQTFTGSWIIGVNALANFGANMGQNSVTMYDVDWRWTAPSLQWRGEALASQTGGIAIDGYYQDISYHTLQLPKTTFLFRTEELHSYGGLDQTTLLNTIGIKQTMSHHIVAELSDAWGNGSDASYTSSGIFFQLITYSNL